MRIIKQELQFDEYLKQQLEFICELSRVRPPFVDGSIRKIENAIKKLKNLIMQVKK